MTRTVARLILAMLLLPCTCAVFLLLMLAIVAPTASGRPPPVSRLLLMWFLLYAFVGGYWLVLWRDMVSWNRRRITLTMLTTVLSLVVGSSVALAANVNGLPLPPAVLLGGGTVPITWVLSTVLIWRETAAERLGRLTAHGMPVLACPLCGYNLAGLTEARCPECGGSFTLEQIVLARPRSGAQPAEL
jgi:peptidoglycan/LPS O-acetylase OafA/YrhL